MAREQEVHEFHRWDTRKQGEAKRPYRLWDAQKKRNVLWRCFGSLTNAHNAALIEVRWEKVNASIEVYDARTQRSHGTYTRKLDHVYFDKGGDL